MLIASAEHSNKNLHQVAFSVNTKNLLTALNFANFIVEKRNVLKELHYIRLYANDKHLVIDATDLDIYLTQKISTISLMHVGEIILHFQILIDLVRKITSNEIFFNKKPEDNIIEITSGESYFKLFTFENSKFPKIPFENYSTHDAEIKFSLKTYELSSLISKTLFASSNEVTRYNLNGVFLHRKIKEIVCVATDAHRLAFSKIKSDITDDFEMILSKKSSLDILKIIKDTIYNNSTLEVILNSQRVKFICDNFVFISKIVEGSYPKYEEFIPKNEQNKLEINKKIFLESVERISTLSHHKLKSIKLIIDTQENGIKLSCFNENAGSAKENIKFTNEKEEFCSFTGKDQKLSINLNPEYLLESVSVLEGDIINIFIIDIDSPIKIKDIKNNTSVIMPLRS